MPSMRDIIMLAGMTALLCLAGCSGKSNPDQPGITDRVSLAAKLSEKGLYAEAAREYQAALENEGLTPAKRSNLCYLLANLAFEKQKDYETALGYYIRARHYDPQSKVLQKITERTVTCLERIGRSLDAQNVLSDATYLAGEDTRQFGGKTVARIGEREITMGELDNEIQKLPTEQQKQFSRDPKAKLEFLRQYVHNKLLEQMARRAGLHKDQEIRNQVEDFEKMLLVRRIYDQHVTDNVQVTPEEGRLYFQAHKDEFKEAETREASGDTSGTKTLDLTDEELFRKNARTIMARLQAQKAAREESKLLRKLMQSQDVILYEGEFE